MLSYTALCTFISIRILRLFCHLTNLVRAVSISAYRPLNLRCGRDEYVFIFASDFQDQGVNVTSEPISSGNRAAEFGLGFRDRIVDYVRIRFERNNETIYLTHTYLSGTYTIYEI